MNNSFPPVPFLPVSMMIWIFGWSPIFSDPVVSAQPREPEETRTDSQGAPGRDGERNSNA